MLRRAQPRPIPLQTLKPAVELLAKSFEVMLPDRLLPTSLRRLRSRSTIRSQGIPAAGLGVGLAFGKRTSGLVGIAECDQQVPFLVEQEQVAVGSVVLVDEEEALHFCVLESLNRHFLNAGVEAFPAGHPSVQKAGAQPQAEDGRLRRVLV